MQIYRRSSKFFEAQKYLSWSMGFKTIFKYNIHHRYIFPKILYPYQNFLIGLNSLTSPKSKSKSKSNFPRSKSNCKILVHLSILRTLPIYCDKHSAKPYPLRYFHVGQQTQSKYKFIPPFTKKIYK